MESDLFDFESLDGDVVKMRYFDITLKSKVGNFEAGTKLDMATIDFEKGQLCLYKTMLMEETDIPTEVFLGCFEVRLAVTKDLQELV